VSGVRCKAEKHVGKLSRLHFFRSCAMITPIPGTQLPASRNRSRCCWDVDVGAKQTKEPTLEPLLKEAVLAGWARIR
jgi:hypothetical protein